jgi:hypothetical protein
MITAKPFIADPFILVFYRPDGQQKPIEFNRDDFSFKSGLLNQFEEKYCLHYQTELKTKYT